MEPCKSIKSRSPGHRAAGRRTHRSLLLLLPVALALVAGCSKTSEPKITGSSSAPPVALSCSWQPGFTYHLRFEISQSTDLEVPEPNHASEHLVIYEQESLVKVTAGSRGLLALDMEILSVAMERAKGGQRVLSFDSSHDAEWIDENGYIPVMKKLIGGHLKFQVASNGAVLRADGITPWLDAALRARAAEIAASDAASGRPSTAQPTVLKTIRTPNGVITTNVPASVRAGPVSSTLRSFFTQDLFKQMIEFHFLPSREVRIGDRWNTAGDTFTSTKSRPRYEATTKFEGWQMHRGTNCARLAVDGRLAAAYQPPGRKLGPQDNFLKGTLWIDRDLQFPIGLSLETQLCIAPATNNLPSGTNRPAVLPPARIIRQHTTTRLLSVKSANTPSAPAPPP